MGLSSFARPPAQRGAPGKIAQGEEHEEPGCIFGEAAVADADVSPQLFNNPEQKLDFRPHTGFTAIGVDLLAAEF